MKGGRSPNGRKNIEAAHPKIVPLRKAEGLTAREVFVLTLVQMQAGMEVYAKSMGMKDLPLEVNPENVTFLEQRKRVLDALKADLKKFPDPCSKGRKGMEDMEDMDDEQ